MRVNESGRSMIEMLGVLAIVGVLSVGGIAGYSKAMTKFKTNKVADQVSMIITNIRTLYAQQTTYDGLNFQNAVKMGVIPDEVGTDASKSNGTNPFAGQVTIGVGKTGNDGMGGNTGAFYLSYAGLPKEACVTLATNDWGSGYSSGFIGMKVAAGSAAATTDVTALTVQCSTNTADAWCSSKGAMLVSTAASACSDQNANVITWKFY